MRSWRLVHIPSGRVAADFRQEEAPTEEFLSAFRNISDPGWELIERELTREEHDDVIRQRRAPMYPPLQDLADGIYWREKGDPAPLAAWVAACDAVKDRNPKPPRDNQGD